MKLPISFDQLKKDPKTAVSYLSIIAVVALFLRYEGKGNSAELKCEERLSKCETKLDEMYEALLKLQKSNSEMEGQISTYKNLGVIK